MHVDDPRDNRTRPSVYLALPDGTADPGGHVADLRQQALRFDLRRVDAVLYTHGHADHVLGLDDMRRFNALQDARIPCYADALTVREIRQTFAYIFDRATPAGGGLPEIDLVHRRGAVLPRTDTESRRCRCGTEERWSTATESDRSPT